MTLFLIILLSVVMVIDCTILVFLVLVQLPKKEAGAGIAFGGAATDALFGAGSGNVLTKVTKWATAIFFALAIVLAIFQNRAHHKSSVLTNLPSSTESATPVAAAPAPAPTVPAANTSAPT